MKPSSILIMLLAFPVGYIAGRLLMRLILKDRY